MPQESFQLQGRKDLPETRVASLTLVWLEGVSVILVLSNYIPPSIVVATSTSNTQKLAYKSWYFRSSFLLINMYFLWHNFCYHSIGNVQYELLLLLSHIVVIYLVLLLVILLLLLSFNLIDWYQCCCHYIIENYASERKHITNMLDYWQCGYFPSSAI